MTGSTFLSTTTIVLTNEAFHYVLNDSRNYNILHWLLKSKSRRFENKILFSWLEYYPFAMEDNEGYWQFKNCLNSLTESEFAFLSNRAGRRFQLGNLSVHPWSAKFTDVNICWRDYGTIANFSNLKSFI